jgi:DNA modification methylase
MNEELFPIEAPAEREQPERQHRGENKLNDLDPKEWLLATKSVWYQDPGDLEQMDAEEIAVALRSQLGDQRAEELLKQLFPSVMLSRAPARGSVKSLHPATFPEPDIARLIRFFTKEGEIVLDRSGPRSLDIACRRKSYLLATRLI